MRKHMALASMLMGLSAMATVAPASAGPHWDRRPVFAPGARGHSVPELGAGTAGVAAAIVVGGVLLLAGYRKKRRSASKPE
jgi:hypothetical protein